LVGFLFGFIRGKAREAVLALLLLMGIATHVLNSYHWQRFWENEKILWWQLWWRAPNLVDGTILLASIPEESFFEDYEVWGPANLIYRPEQGTLTIGAEVINPDTTLKIRAGTVEERGMRGLSFVRNFNHSLLIALPSNHACLKVIDSQDLILPLRFEPHLVPLLRFSYKEQIDLSRQGKPPPAAIFGAEPAQDWCYYYQHAERARQAGDWATVVQLGEAAFDANLRPRDRIEWLPFLQGYLWAGNKDRAEDIAVRMIDDATIASEICAALASRNSELEGEMRLDLMEILCEK
jgi:hypothetical protein